MVEQLYQDAIDEMKRQFPETDKLTGRFSIENGVLYYTHGGGGCNIMGELQTYINKLLGQKVYRAEYIAYKDVYARSEEEAKEFLENNSPKLMTRTKIYPTEYMVFN